ncbi:MAG TPA: YggS family pyridoxal phosphate-dependent enzyme [Acidimicrobiia bacterium]|nr:YggS family pyridoxal phosphate-dependent enzyme [Acidimicrobiia bacterium]
MSYDEVMARVHDAATRSGRAAEEITVVAVSKTMSLADIEEVYSLGHRDFGENRAGEMADKAASLPDDIRWHFVGSLQSNKVRVVRGVVSLLHSMDRRSLAKAWMKGQGLPPPVLAQVNVGHEPQKSGLSPDEVAAELTWMEGLGLEVRGLMAIPPIPLQPEDSRDHFRSLRLLREELRPAHPMLTELSMGMTDDFEVAIEEGASIIRVGRAIFGPRNTTGE